MPNNLRIEVVSSENDDPSTITIGGELDADNCSELATALADQNGNLVLDLVDLRFIDSSGLSTILERCSSITAKGHQFKVRGVNGQVARVFEIAGVSRLLGSADGPETQSSSPR